MVIVDSDVWSEAFRSKAPVSKYVKELKRLIDADEVVMIAPIRQEILSGIRDERMYDELKEQMRAFPSRRVSDKLYELGALLFNTCRRTGIQGSHTDFLICACSVEWKVQILSKDKDYHLYEKYIPIELRKL
ncbi:MAG: PIN domain nuclease [Verrucomicrobiota bacterium]|nr:PIN domain nuclease [Verrucomicrobiota bacterium]